jgi:GNAT superfamily N-acetyltransferase
MDACWTSPAALEMTVRPREPSVCARERPEHGSAEASFVMPLKDGTLVRLRGIRPDDKWRLQHGLTRMSPRSIYRRFFRSVPRLSSRELQYFTEVDQSEHIAWGAAEAADPHETGLGIAGLIREPGRPQRAELSIAVIDAYHGRGLGTILLATLYALAEAAGIERLSAYALPENDIVVTWLPCLGARFLDDDAHVALELLIGAAFPDNPTAHRFHDTLTRVRERLGTSAR